MMKFIGFVLLFFGFIVIAGSANDCDGKCMEQANTIGEMLTVISVGLIMSIAGGLILSKTGVFNG